MQIPVTPHRGQAKPWNSIPRIDWRNPIARGLIFYAYDFGQNYIELAKGGLGTAIDTNAYPPRAASKFGSGTKWPGTSPGDGHKIPLSGADYRVKTFAQSAPYSVAMGTLGSAIGTAGGYITCLGDTTSTNDSLGFAANGGGTNIVLLSNNGGASSAFSNSFSANTYQSYLVAATGSSAATLYYNGKQDSTSAVSMTFSGSSALQVVLNSNSSAGSDFGGGMAGFVYYWAGWNRVLTSFEAFQLYADPWCFLIYPEDEMMSALVGTGGGSKFRKTLSLYGSGAGKRQGQLS